ncbi:hypothetical protein Tco_0973489 [Tanacetum coccineum]
MESAPSSLHNIYSFYEREPSETRSEEMVEVDINTLTMEQYMALTIGNNGNNVNFEIKGQFIKELRYNTFTDTKGEDAYEHMQRSKRWEDKIPAGQSIHRTFSTKHLFKSIVLHRKLPRNWKRSLISSKIWMKHCIVLGKDIPTRQMLDSQGPIPKMPPARALESIQDIADHSNKLHDGASIRQMSDSSDGIVAITNKLDNLRCDVKKLKENVHVVQVGCEIYEGIHKTKECPLNDEEIIVEEVHHDWIKKFKEKTVLKLKEQNEAIKGLEAKSTVRLNARFSAVLQNQQPAKEKDPGSFILPCLIGNLNASNALDDLGASIRVMPFFMFKRLGLVNLKPVNMLIEMEDKSMQASKEVGEEKIMFKANEVKLPLPVVFVFAVNNVEAPNDFCVHVGLEEQMIDDDFDKNIEDFLELNDLLPKEEVYPFGVLFYLGEEFDMGMGLDDLGDELENLLESPQPEVGYIE